MPNRKTKTEKSARPTQSNVQSSDVNQPQSSSNQSPNLAQDQETMSNETLSDVNQLNAFGGDRPQREIAADDSRESVEDIEDGKYNR